MINFLDLQKLNQQYADELKRAASDVIDSGWYLLGKQVNSFEKKLSEYLNVDCVITTSNGLDALRLIFRAYIELGLMNENDEVIVPANTYIASILAITDNRLKPVLVEPDILTYNLDTSLIEKHITDRTKAIMPVHLYGRVCWSEKLETLAQKYMLKIIEDNAQAIGAKWKGKYTGALGHAAGNSFYPAKNLGAMGDAGAVTTNDSKLGEAIRSLANYGSQIKYYNNYQGLNCRMDEMQAAFLNVKLDYLNKENELRRDIAATYIDNIINPEIVLPEWPENSDEHVWHLFVIRSQKRKQLQKYLSENNIQTLIHYPVPPHKQDAFKPWNDQSYPITEKIHNEVLSLPISPVNITDEIEMISIAINRF